MDGENDVGGCSQSSMVPLSVWIKSEGPAECTVFWDTECEKPAYEADDEADQCTMIWGSNGWLGSFKCEVSELDVEWRTMADGNC